MSLVDVWRKLRYGAPIVVVSGLPRSGTSMAMKMLSAGGLGLTSDGERAADDDNPKGYFEDERVKDLARDPDRSWVKGSRGRAIKVITSLLRYLPPENYYKVILMRRDLGEVLASQQKMLDHREEEDAIEDQRMRDLWEDDIWRAHYLLKHRRNFDWIEVHYKDVVADPHKQAQRIADFLGGLDPDRMVEAVDPKLYRNRAQT